MSEKMGFEPKSTWSNQIWWQTRKAS